jgi:hypothetical protein
VSDYSASFHGSDTHFSTCLSNLIKYKAYGMQVLYQIVKTEWCGGFAVDLVISNMGNVEQYSESC